MWKLNVYVLHCKQKSVEDDTLHTWNIFINYSCGTAYPSLYCTILGHVSFPFNFTPERPLNTSVAVYLHFLLIYHRQHCNPPPFHSRHTVRSHTVNPICLIHDPEKQTPLLQLLRQHIVPAGLCRDSTVMKIGNTGPHLIVLHMLEEKS